MIESHNSALLVESGQKDKPSEMLGGLPSVGWLAELCGLPPADASLSLASVLLDKEGPAGPANDYIRWWIRHSDPGSRFEQATHHLVKMPDAAVVTALRSMGYDGLLYQREGEIVGHVFFQRHGADLCAFSSSISEGYRGGKLWATVSIDFVAFASRVVGVTRARVGGGNHSITRGLVALLKCHAPELGWSVAGDGWIDFAARNKEGSQQA